MESPLWLSPHPPCSLPSALRPEQKSSAPSQSPVSPRDQSVPCSPVSALSLKTVPSHLPGGACSRGPASCLQGLTGAPWGLLCAGPSLCEENFRSRNAHRPCSRCVSSAVLPALCWASSRGRSTWLGHVARGGASAQAPPTASPPILPSLVAPPPSPSVCFYSLSSAESSAF